MHTQLTLDRSRFSVVRVHVTIKEGPLGYYSALVSVRRSCDEAWGDEYHEFTDCTRSELHDALGAALEVLLPAGER